MNEIFTQLLIVFAIWRVALFPHDEIFQELMFRLGASQSSTPPYKLFGDSWISRMLLCPACFSMWLSTIAVVINSSPVHYILAYSAAVIFLERKT